MCLSKRKFLQNQIGYSNASELVKGLDSFIKSDGCKSVVSPLSIEKYNDKLKYKNKYKIEESIKNINLEMEEAKTEFSKLFQNDNNKTTSY